MVDYWHSVAAPSWTHADSDKLDEVCEAHLATLLSNNRTALITCWGIPLGGTLVQGIAARLRARGEQVAFLGLLDTRPPETQNWQEKKLMVWTRKCWRRLTANARPSPAAQQGGTSTELFTTIEGNYADAVRLLTTAHSVPFDGKSDAVCC